MLGEVGYLPKTADFFQALPELDDRYSIVLTIDEVQAAVGRTGKFWVHEHFGVEADIITFAKGIAIGFPISDIAARHELIEGLRYLSGLNVDPFRVQTCFETYSPNRRENFQDEPFNENVLVLAGSSGQGFKVATQSVRPPPSGQQEGLTATPPISSRHSTPPGAGL